MDVDVTGILTREKTIDEAGDDLIEMIRRTANGRNTAAEALGHREFSIIDRRATKMCRVPLVHRQVLGSRKS